MIWTFSSSFGDHARERLRGLNPIKWEGERTRSNDGGQGVSDTDAASNESVNAERRAKPAEDPSTETGEKRSEKLRTDMAEKVTGV